MGLKYKHGAYSTNLGEASIAETITPIFDGRNNRVRRKVRLDVSGRLRAASYADTQTSIDLLKAALLNDNVDSGLVTAASVAGSHYLDTSSTLYGTRVVHTNFPDSKGADNTTYRHFSFAVEGEFLDVDGAADGLMQFHETITLLGDGSADTRLVETVDLPPEPQTLKDFTIVRAIQEGTAVGNLLYPSFPDPVFSEGYIGKRARIAKGSPEIIGSSARNYPISWSYAFEFSDDPGLATPNIS